MIVFEFSKFLFSKHILLNGKIENELRNKIQRCLVDKCGNITISRHYYEKHVNVHK